MSEEPQVGLGLSRPTGRLDGASLSAQATSDGFGERVLLFDDLGTPTWEVLRLRQDFAGAPGVRDALRTRLEQCKGLSGPAFAAAKIVEEPGAEGGVLLMSAYTPGRRLSESKRARSAAFAMTVVRDLVNAIAALQATAENVAHGSLTMDRIVVGLDGRLSIRDHVLGGAIGVLALSPAQLWSDLGVLRPHGEDALTPQQLDVVDVALVALSALLGRPITPDDYPGGIGTLVERNVLFPPLRRWLDAAFLLEGDGLGSAAEAVEAIREYFPARLPGDSEVRGLLAAFGSRTAASGGPAPAAPKSRLLEITGKQPLALGAAGTRRLIGAGAPAGGRTVEPLAPAAVIVEGPPPPAAKKKPRREVAEGAPERPPEPQRFPSRVADDDRTRSTTGGRRHLDPVVAEPAVLQVPAPDSARVKRLQWALGAALLLVALQAAFIARLYVASGQPPPRDAGRTANEPVAVAAPMFGPPAPEAPKEIVPPATAPAAAATSTAPPPMPPPAAAAASLVRVVSPIDLTVNAGGRQVGTTARPFSLPPGPHVLEFVNTALGYKSTSNVDVVSGRGQTVQVDPGPGSLNINAAPWAEVWVDGRLVGETPIGGVSASLGEHEIVLRHPQLGERREVVVVRADGVTRLSVDLVR